MSSDSLSEEELCPLFTRLSHGRLWLYGNVGMVVSVEVRFCWGAATYGLHRRMSRRTLRAVAVTEPGAVATEVLPQKDDTLLWAKCKYRMCLACYPDHKSRDGIAMFMRQRFFNPENCEESDLHPLVFPPPLSQVVVYGPVLFVSMKNDTVGPLALAAWKAAWQQMRTHSWVTADAHNEHTKPCELCEDRDEEDEDIHQEYSEVI